MPVVAAMHFFYMVVYERGGSIKGLLECCKEPDVIFIGGLEALFTVCEDFII